MQNIKYHDFIGTYTNVFEDESTIDYLIEQFEKMRAGDMCGNRQDADNAWKTTKEDDHFFVNVGSAEFFKDGLGGCHLIHEALQPCFEHYVNEFATLKNANLLSRCIKMQRTPPGAGYHIWHAEAEDLWSSHRCLTWIIYLTDHPPEDGAETEFLYQRLRVNPKRNSAVIWPAAYTHTHRGNVNLGNKDKYILTGWFDFNG